jgi:hypothetical protein
MLSQTRSSFLLIASLALFSACSDDDKKEVDTDAPPASVGDGGGTSPNADGSVVPGLDGGPVVSIDAGGGNVVLPDGAVVAPDGALVTVDGGTLADGAVVGGGGGLDATVGPCDVNDPRYGCGTRAGEDWLSFNGFEVDLKNKTAWTKPVTVVDDDEIAGICASLTTGGFRWELPQMSVVRQLAAGCDKTMPGGSCQVGENMVYTYAAGDCACTGGGVGPNKGKFCRPEVPECETLWVWTHTDETGGYQHWFYDVSNGAIVPEYVGVNIALTAKGRCVHALSDSELPVVLQP